MQFHSISPRMGCIWLYGERMGKAPMIEGVAASRNTKLLKMRTSRRFQDWRIPVVGTSESSDQCSPELSDLPLKMGMFTSGILPASQASFRFWMAARHQGLGLSRFLQHQRDLKHTVLFKENWWLVPEVHSFLAWLNLTQHISWPPPTFGRSCDMPMI